MKFYILTSDRLVNETCKMIDYSFKKYWPEIEVVILGYKSPDKLPVHAKFVSIGIDLGVDTICPQVSEYFESVSDKFFVFEVDDKPLVGRVNHNLFNTLVDVIKNNDKIGRIGLTKDNFRRLHKNIEHKNGLDIFENEHNTEYRISCTSSIWNKDFFVNYAKKCTTLWDFEIRGSELSKTSDWKIFGSSPWILDTGHLYRKGGKLIEKWYYGIYTGKKLPIEDIEYIKKIYLL